MATSPAAKPRASILSLPRRSPIVAAVKRRVPVDPEGDFSGVDGRSAHARFIRRHQDMLTDHLGGSPTAPQRELIKHAAMLALRLHLMDLRFLATGDMTTHDHNTYLAWGNTYRRTLVALGLSKVKPASRAPTLDEHRRARVQPA